MTRRRSKRGAQRGQVLPIMALAMTVLIGAVAIAVDLSVNTQLRRNLQNATDSSSLAGVQELSGAAITQSERITAAETTLNVIHNHMGWASWGSFTTSTVTSDCSAGGSTCQFTVTAPAPESNYTITVNTPPLTSTNTLYNGNSRYLEVVMHDTSSNSFAAVLGFANSNEGSRSVAYHGPPASPMPFALYASTQVTSGNQNETIRGDVYVTQTSTTQSYGQSAVCADFVNPTDPTSGGGHLVYGVWPPSPPASPEPSRSVTYGDGTPGADCSGKGSGFVGQQALSGGNGGTCPSSTWDATRQLCIANPSLLVPLYNPPNESQAVVVSDCRSFDSGTQPGMYILTPGTCGKSYSIGGPTLSCITFILRGVVVLSGTATTTQTPFGPGCNGYTASDNPNDGKYSVYGEAVSPSPQTDCGTNTGQEIDPPFKGTWTTTGTLFMPSGVMKANNKEVLNVDGQAIVGAWCDQSGNHQNAAVTYDTATSASLPEAVKLVD